MFWFWIPQDIENQFRQPESQINSTNLYNSNITKIMRTNNNNFQYIHRFPVSIGLDMTAQSDDFNKVSVLAEAENRTEPRAYQTESVSIPGGRIIPGFIFFLQVRDEGEGT